MTGKKLPTSSTKLCFRDDRKTKMTAWLLVGWDIFYFSFETACSWTEFNKTSQEAKFQGPLQSLCFSDLSENQDGRPDRSVNKGGKLYSGERCVALLVLCFAKKIWHFLYYHTGIFFIYNVLSNSNIAFSCTWTTKPTVFCAVCDNPYLYTCTVVISCLYTLRENKKTGRMAQ